MSGDNDLVDGPGANQNVGQTTGEPTMTLGKCLTILVVANLALALIVFAISQAFGVGLTEAMLAWGVCAFATIAGHIVSRYPSGDDYLLLRLAGGMVFRTMLPMGFLVWGFRFREPQIQTPILWITMLVYLGGLALDSYLSLIRSNTGEQL